jgi:hypothetical protein
VKTKKTPHRRSGGTATKRQARELKILRTLERIANRDLAAFAQAVRILASLDVGKIE